MNKQPLKQIHKIWLQKYYARDSLTFKHDITKTV